MFFRPICQLIKRGSLWPNRNSRCAGGRLSISLRRRNLWREAIVQDNEWDDAKEKRYGDPASNVQAMALNRAAASSA